MIKKYSKQYIFNELKTFKLILYKITLESFHKTDYTNKMN